MGMLPLSLEEAALICASLDASAIKTAELAVNGEPTRAAERLQLHTRMLQLRDRVHRTIVNPPPAIPQRFADRTPEQQARSRELAQPVDTFPVCVEGDGVERCVHGPNAHPGCFEAVPA